MNTEEIDPVLLGPEHFTYVDIASVDREVKRITGAQHLLVSDAPSRARKLIRTGDVLVSTVRPNLNAVALVSADHHDQIASTGFSVLRSNPEVVESTYLYYFVQTRAFIDHLTHVATGASYPAVTDDDILDCTIPVPPLAEQRRIAAILRAADDEGRRRRYTQTLSDGLLGAVFVRMFGDPATNPMGWEQITLADALLSVNDGPHVSPEYAEAGVPFLSTRNIRPGQVIWDDMRYISWEDARIHWQKVKAERGDILYTKGGTTGLAKVVDFDRDIAVWVHVAVLKISKDRVDPKWLESMLNTPFCYAQSQDLTMGIVNRDLGLTRMPKIQMYLPPYELQQRFVRVTGEWEHTYRQQAESARQSDHLFETLLHRAFAGEL